MSFSAPPERVIFDGLLFDMDGTIIDSTAAIVKHWHRVSAEIGVDPEVVLATSHGRRSIDTLKALCPEKANVEYVRKMEELIPKLHGGEAVEIPGARALLDSLVSANVSWAIVTSATIPLVMGWLDVLKLSPPEHLITAESVEVGKPDPACYRLGREMLKLRSDAKVVVFEDSPAGIKAGKAAGCQVVGLVTTHSLEQIVAEEPDWVIQDLHSVKMVEFVAGRVTLQISNALTHVMPAGIDGLTEDQVTYTR